MLLVSMPLVLITLKEEVDRWIFLSGAIDLIYKKISRFYHKQDYGYVVIFRYHRLITKYKINQFNDKIILFFVYKKVGLISIDLERTWEKLY